ncbi:hypothetical protein XMD579_001363 [Marinobacterium sp. xm-d-579]|uniref:hypothetical protein n=1 Tax=Marinobacterium sp. xm-d-579 TaxID=2497734 RepID=UPI0015695D55|nr:hypothetical protein [Marinobacterium sp. xm-d-579]NRP36540.1 hypothetical protein [Marinobacterium sp. xm-d-579]
MPYIKRNERGDLVAVSQEVLPGFIESTASDDSEVLAFSSSIAGQEHVELSRSDLDFVRVLDDVIELLMAKNVIQFTELPDASQAKMLMRRRLRDGLDNTLDILPADEKLFLK